MSYFLRGRGTERRRRLIDTAFGGSLGAPHAPFSLITTHVSILFAFFFFHQDAERESVQVGVRKVYPTPDGSFFPVRWNSNDSNGRFT